MEVWGAFASEGLLSSHIAVASNVPVRAAVGPAPEFPTARTAVILVVVWMETTVPGSMAAAKTSDGAKASVGVTLPLLPECVPVVEGDGVVIADDSEGDAEPDGEVLLRCWLREARDSVNDGDPRDGDCVAKDAVMDRDEVNDIDGDVLSMVCDMLPRDAVKVVESVGDAEADLDTEGPRDDESERSSVALGLPRDLERVAVAVGSSKSSAHATQVGTLRVRKL
jgi:hypothetical protein